MLWKLAVIFMKRKRRKIIVEVQPPLKVRVKRYLESSGIPVCLVYLLIVVFFLGIFMSMLHLFWKQQYIRGGMGQIFDN